MATFPADIPYVLGSATEEVASAVMRSDMERGVPKQRRMASDVMAKVKVTMQFKDIAHHAAFESWYYTQINAGADYFTWQHPRTGATVQARIVGGTLGTLTPIHGTWRPGFQRCRRDATFEYLKAAY